MINLLRSLALFCLSACLIQAQETPSRTARNQLVGRSTTLEEHQRAIFAAEESARMQGQGINPESTQSGDQVVPHKRKFPDDDVDTAIAIEYQRLENDRRAQIADQIAQRRAAMLSSPPPQISSGLRTALENARRVFNPDSINNN